MPKHQAFVDYFTREFMEELWYLQKVARGDIPKRVEADPWETFFNVTQGLLSLAPIPGLPLGFLLSKELIKKCVDYGEKAVKLARKANAEAKDAYDKSNEFLAKIDKLQQGYELIRGKPESKGMLQQEGDGPMDLTAIRVLVELIGRGLAERYEHVLSRYIDTDNPEKSYIPLARVMAKRLFQYLQSQPLLDEALNGDLVAQRTRLLNGVLLGNVDKSWREKLTAEGSGLVPRFIKDMHKVKLPLQDAQKKQLGMEELTAEGVIKRSAWYDDKQSYQRFSPRSRSLKTDWDDRLPKQPKYGYAYIADHRVLPKDSKPLPASGSYSAPPHINRYHQPVSLKDIQDYLASPEIQGARHSKQTASFNFHTFLHQRQQDRPQDLQAVCHDNLTTIENWSFANFSGVDFSGATITGNISGADFSGSYLVGITAKGIVCQQDHPVNLSRAQLGFADLHGAKLPKANLIQAELQLTNLSGADLTDIQSLGANWYKTDLTGVTRQDLLAEQAKQVAEIQRQFQDRMREFDSRIEKLEETLKPMLAQLDALEAQSKTAAGKNAELEVQIAKLQTEINEAVNSKFKQFCETELHELRQCTAMLEAQLQQLKIHNLTGVGDVGRKILVEQTKVKLDHHVEYLKFYLPPTVITALPEKMTLDELMIQLNSTGAKELKEHKNEAMGGTELANTRKAGNDSEVSSSTLSSSTATSPTLLPTLNAITAIEQFLQQKESLLLLLGEPGAGKSLSIWQVIRRLVAQFQPDMTEQQISQCWLPIHVELNQLSLNNLPGLIDQQLKSYGLTDGAITKLKQATTEPKVLLLLDGYDEIRQQLSENRREHTDLFKCIGGKAWKPGQFKVLVTCRRRYLADSSEERMIFGVGQDQRYQRYELLPFSLAQVERYINTHISAEVGGEPGQYLKAIEAIKASDSLKKLVSNPFILYLFLEIVRSGLTSQGINYITRFDLYREFFDQCLEREVKRLTPTEKEALGRDKNIILINDFKRMARYLALSMYANRTIKVAFTNPQQPSLESTVWFTVLKQVAEEADQEYQALEAQSSKSAERFFGLSFAPDKATFMRQALARANKLASVLSLRENGASYEFRHTSFYEYLVAASVVDLANKDPTYEAAALGFFKQRLIQSESAVVDFLSELATQARTNDQQVPYLRLRSKLFEIIQRSAKETTLGWASSNAATILNACHEPLSYLINEKSWAGVQLPSADLSYCVLAHSDLSSANLRGANLGHSVLYHSNLNNADLRDVSWGEYPRLQLSHGARAVVHHPTQPWLAIAQGNEIVLVHRDVGERIGEALVGHTKGVTSVAFSPNGLHLVSGGEDHTVRLWELSSRRQLGAPMRGHTNEVTSVAFSPKGLHLASGSRDYTVRLWEVSGQKPLGAMKGHMKGVSSVAFSPDGSHLVSGSWDHTIRLWEVSGQKPLGAMKGHTKGVSSVAFSPNGLHLASGGEDHTVRLWELSSRRQLGAPMCGHTNEVTSVAFSPNGLHLASGSKDYTVRLWETVSQRPLGIAMRGHTNEVQNVAFSPDGSHLISGSWDETVRLWETTSHMPLGASMGGHTSSVRSLAFSPDGLRLASGSEDHTVRLWELNNQTLQGIAVKRCSGEVMSAVFDSDSSCFVLARSRGSKAIFLLKIESQALLMSREAIYLGDGTWTIFNLGGSHSGPRSLPQISPQLSAGFHSAWMDYMYYTESYPQGVAGQMLLGVSMFKHGYEENSVIFSHDGQLLASTGGQDKTVWLWDVEHKRAQGAPLTGHTDYVGSIAFSPQRRVLASGSHDKTVRLWDAEHKQARGAPLTGHTNSVKSLVFNSDGSLLASMSEDSVRLWELPANDTNARCIAVFSYHQGIKSVAFAPRSGRHAASSTLEAKSTMVEAALAPRYSGVAEDLLAIGDGAGTISLWAVSHKDAHLRFISTPKHSGMPLLFNGAQLRGCKMSMMSKRLLKQHGGEVNGVVVADEAIRNTKPDESKKSRSNILKYGVSAMVTAGFFYVGFNILRNGSNSSAQSSLLLKSDILSPPKR